MNTSASAVSVAALRPRTNKGVPQADAGERAVSAHGAARGALHKYKPLPTMTVGGVGD